MMKRRGGFFGLSVIFSLVVFSIFLITTLILFSIALMFMQLGFVDRLGLRYAFPLLPAAMLASIIVGTVVSLVFGHIPLRPIREMIAAINRLADGDFSVRLSRARAPEFKELRDSFNRMAQELSSIEMLRSDFINNFSHEFKTPIVSIKGFAELLAENGLTPEERSEYLGIIIRESTRLAAMATNVLNLSRVENQTIVADQKVFNLSEQLRRCILLLQSQWERKGLRFDIELEEIPICANEELLDQVWVNLLDNAIKFSHEGGKITLTMAASNGAVTVILRDEGQGIGPGDLPHIFDKFYQSDASRAIPGNGLGLALAQKIVQLHGGGISCRSELGQFTEFSVRLPSQKT